MAEIGQYTKSMVSDLALHFGHFAKVPEYRQVNRRLIQLVLTSNYLPSSFTHVDVATGTGLIPQLMIEQCGKISPGYQGTIIGIDPNHDSLQLAREITPKNNNFVVTFIEGLGQNTAQLIAGLIPDEGADYVTIHDALHEIPGEDQKRLVLAAMASVLKPGGVLTYNSGFTTVAMDKDPRVWGMLKLKAFKSLGKRRDRTITVLEIHKPEEYAQMITDQGLKVIHDATTPVPLTLSAIRAFCHYPEFIEGLFRDMQDTQSISLREKHRILMRVLDVLKSESPSLRIWHEIIAQKP